MDKRLGIPENPFSFKVAQIFTGFGIGCGVGIGVGRPIHLGAIPAMQQVMTAARGATDAFSGVGRHVNSSLRRLGVNNVEAGIGCGIGVGHGFGVGIALKPGVVRGIQTSFGQMLEKIMLKLGNVPGLSSAQSVIPVSVQSSVGTLTGPSIKTALVFNDNGSTMENKAAENTHQLTVHSSNHSHILPPPEKPIVSRTDKVLDDFLKDPLFKDDDTKLNEVNRNLQSENAVLQMLMKHQHVIEELMEENQKLQEILVLDLKIPLSKLQSKIGSGGSSGKPYYPCSDCFQCRRRIRRKSAR